MRQMYQQKLCALLSASLFSMISPAKYGRLVVFHFCEVVTQLPEVHFWALPPTSITSRTLEVIEMFPDAPLESTRRTIRHWGGTAFVIQTELEQDGYLKSTPCSTGGIFYIPDF